MKVYTPEISWHERDPIYTCAFHPIKKKKLATSGVTGCIRLWEVGEKGEEKRDGEKTEDIVNGIGHLSNCRVKFIASLKRHCKSVNVIRWNPEGEILASAGDEACIFLWKENEVKNQKTLDMDEDENKENWFSFKTFRGHLEDILDLSWSKDGSVIISGSIDNSVYVWDVTTGNKIAILKEPKGFVQGVVYDPLGANYCCISTDRCLRIFSTVNNKCIQSISKMQMSKENVDPMPPAIRIFHDDTMKSFFRRMCYTSDGNLLFAPSGCLEIDNKLINTSYIFTRNAYTKPCLYIPHDKPSIAIACCPNKYELNKKKDTSADNIDNLFSLPYRYIFAIATEDSVYIYDTQNLTPFAYTTGIHYSNLSDLTWSNDGKMLCISSIDGFCSFVIFGDKQLGEIYTEPVIMEEVVESCEASKTEAKSVKLDIKSKLQKQSEINSKSKKVLENKSSQEVSSKMDDVYMMDEDSSDKSEASSDKASVEIIDEIEGKKDALKESNESNTNEIKTLAFKKKDDSVKIAGANSVKRLKLIPL